MREPSPEELRRLAGHSLEKWALELASRLTPDDAARLMLAAAVAAAVAAWGVEDAAEMLRQAADRLDGTTVAPVEH